MSREIPQPLAADFCSISQSAKRREVYGMTGAFFESGRGLDGALRHPAPSLSYKSQCHSS